MATATGNNGDTDRIGVEVVFSHLTNMGGYVVFMLAWLAKLLGNGTWAFLKSTGLPDNERDANFLASLTERADGLLGQLSKAAGVLHPSLFAGYVDDTGVCYVVLGGSDGWWSRSKLASGLRIWAIKKVIKRLKSFNRPAILGGELTELKVVQVSDEAFLQDPNFRASVEAKMLEYPEDIRPTYEEVAERLLDGIGVISPRLLNKLIEVSAFHSDPVKADQQKRRIKHSWVFNGRFWTELGFIKGNFILAAPGAYPDADWDLLVPACAIKEEVLSLTHKLAILEPQGPKTKVVTDVQTLLNNPWLHPKVFMVAVITDFFAKLRRDIEGGTALEQFSDLEAQRSGAYSRGRFEQTVNTAMKLSTLDAAWRGINYLNSPFMVTRLASGKVANLLDKRNGRLRIPMPCVISEQIISESAARAAGYDISVNSGEVRRLVEQGVHVMNDLDYVFAYDDQGGWDQDDFAKLFYRTFEGRKVIVVVRSPNELGQYTILNYVEGEEFPTYETVEGRVVSFPTIEGPAPKQLSVALKDGSLRYTGLPSDLLPKSNKKAAEYSKADFKADILACVGMGDPGMPSNVRMLWADAVKMLRATYRCSQEKMVDAFTQREAGSGIMDGEAIMAETEDMLRELSLMDVSFDWHFCRTRGLVKTLRRLNPNVSFRKDGIFSVLWEIMDKEITEFEAWAKKLGQDNAAPPSPVVLDLGGYNWAMEYANMRVKPAFKSLTPQQQMWKLNYNKARDLVKAVRGAMGNAQSELNRAHNEECARLNLDPREVEKPKLPKEAYQAMYKPLMDHFNSISGIERHTFAMSVMSICYTLRTGPGEWSDVILWNSMVNADGTPQSPYPYIIEALVFFGIAGEVEYDEDNQRPVRVMRNTWNLSCDICGREGETDDPVKMQKFAIQGKCNVCLSEGR